MSSSPVTAPSSHPVAEPAGRGGRLVSLDGLRGLAALVVVVHHCALTYPSLAQQWFGPVRGAQTWWAAYSPLHLFWAGDEAVLVFFLLSGLVLARPLLAAPRPGTWPAYYRKRLVRLYVPVVAAVAATGVVLALVPRLGGPGWSWWMAAHVTTDGDLRGLLRDAVLLTGTDWRNSVLWSMRIEVWFSLLLPLFVVLARPLTVPLVVSVPVVLAAIGWAAAQGHDLLSHLLVFAVGVLLAQRLDVLAGWGTRLSAARGSGWAWTALVVAGLGALMAQWELKGLGAAPGAWVPVGRPVTVAGAALLVFCTLHCPAVRRFAELRFLQWLGALSFSLYLVHEPIVVSLATRAPATSSGLAVVLGVGLPVSLLAAVVFSRLVERPSRRLAGWAGRLGGPRPAAAPSAGTPPVAPGSVAPGSVAPGSVAPGSVVPAPAVPAPSTRPLTVAGAGRATGPVRRAAAGSGARSRLRG